MIPSFEPNRKGRRALVALVALVSLASGPVACTPNLVERAIEARGGALDSYGKSVDAEVFFGIPGTWSWEVAYRAPESFRWSLETYGEEQHLVFDGTNMRHLLGGAALPPVAADEAVRSQAGWFAVTSLDVLEDPRARWRELPPSALPEGVARGLVAELAGAPEPFRLYFDDRTLLVGASGRVAMAPIGAGALEATFSQFREVDGFLLPFAGAYELNGTPLMRESVREWRPNDPALEAPSAFSVQ